MDRIITIRTCEGFKTVLFLKGQAMVRLEDVRELPRAERLRVLGLQKAVRK